MPKTSLFSRLAGLFNGGPSPIDSPRHEQSPPALPPPEQVEDARVEEQDAGMRGIDPNSRSIMRQEPEISVTVATVDAELRQLMGWRYHDVDEDGNPRHDHWWDMPEHEKLGELLRETSVMGLPADQGRDYIAREVDLDQIPEAEQRRIMGEAWERFGPAQRPAIQQHGPTPPEQGIRPLQTVRADAPEIRAALQKPLTP